MTLIELQEKLSAWINVFTGNVVGTENTAPDDQKCSSAHNRLPAEYPGELGGTSELAKPFTRLLIDKPEKLFETC